MSSKFSFIRGDTFSQVGTYCNNAKRPIDLTDIDLEASLYSADGTFNEALTVDKLDQVANKGKFVMSASDTTSWPLGVLNFKVSKTVAGVKTSLILQCEVTA